MAVAVAACGGDDGNDDEAVTPAPTEATTTVVTTPPATDPPPTEVETTTTETPTTTTTTIDPEQALATEVERDYREGWRRLRAAQQDPTDSASRRRALRYFSGESREAVESTIDKFVDRRWRILPSPSTDATVAIERGPELDSATTATLQACVVDPWVLVETAGAPNGDDAIVDDAIYTYRNEVVMELVNGVWTTAESVEIGEWTGRNECLGE